MALGLVSPLLNRGVRSRWLASLPGAGTTKMLVIDSNGDTSFQDIPVAAWGSITGTLSAQTDLQNALNAKADSSALSSYLPLSGGTLTGRLTTPSILLSGNFSSAAWTTSGVGLSHTARTLTDTSSTGTVAAAYTNVLGGNTIAASSATTFTDYASLFLGSPTAGTNVTITNGFSLITAGAARFGGSLYQPDLQWMYWGNSAIFRGWAGNSLQLNNIALKNVTEINFGSGNDVVLIRDAADILAQRRSTNSQTFRIYNTFTDASNYIRQSLSFTTYSSTVHAQLAVEGAGTGAVNVPFVITPRGTGAFILGPMPDGTATRGNARGQYAVDLQTLRSAATEVASGESSFVAGRANTASNFRSVALGFGNSVSQTNGFAAGNSNTVSGSGVENGIALGASNTASSGSAVAVGFANLASGSRAFATGDSTQSTAFCTSTFGHRSVADRYAMTAFSAGWFSANGDAQRIGFVARIKTTNNTATTMMLDGSSARLTIPSGKLFLFVAKIVGVKSDGTSRACYIREGAIINIAGTTSLVGAITTIGADHEDNAAADVAITADDTNDALDISVTGITSETWRWVAVVEGVEVAYGT